MEFFARLEADSTSGRNGNFRAGAWVASDSCFAGPHAEDAEAAQFDTVAGRQSIFHALEDGVHGRLCLDPRQAGTLRDFMHYILFDQMNSLRTGGAEDPAAP